MFAEAEKQLRHAGHWATGTRVGMSYLMVTAIQVIFIYLALQRVFKIQLANICKYK